MTGYGPLAIEGGGEHLAGCQVIERTLLDLAGATHPKVVVIPVAAGPRQLPRTAALARNYWSRLGTEVTVALPDDRGSEHALEAVAQADVVVLPGGHPNRLVAALGASTVWDRVVEQWMDGMAVTGSSAGAMCLFEWRLRLYPPSPLEPIPGLGLLDGYVTAPHFGKFGGPVLGRLLAPRLAPLGVIGIDEATALVGRPGDLRVVGRGAVTVIEEGIMTSYEHGEGVPVDVLTGCALRLQGHLARVGRLRERFVAAV